MIWRRVGNEQRPTFVGRAQQLEQAREQLSRERWLTVAGAPGSGKTRFALELAAQHPCFFVPNAGVATRTQLIALLSEVHALPKPAVASALRDLEPVLLRRTALERAGQGARMQRQVERAEPAGVRYNAQS